MPGEPKPTDQPVVDKPTPTDDKPAVKTYTQEEYDALVKERDSFKQSHDTLTDLSSNERFRDFIADEDRRLALGDEEYNKIYGDKGTDTDDEGDDFGDLPDDEKFAALQEKIANQESELKSLREEGAQRKYTDAKTEMQKELHKLETDEKIYPLFHKTITRDGQEVPVRELMKAELSRAAARDQDMTLDQAYRIVTYDAQRQLGREDAETALKEKREAARVGIPVSSPGRTTSGEKSFKTPREAVESVMTDLGL